MVLPIMQPGSGAPMGPQPAGPLGPSGPQIGQPMNGQPTAPQPMMQHFAPPRRKGKGKAASK
jgi:hypothetical protein